MCEGVVLNTRVSFLGLVLLGLSLLGGCGLYVGVPAAPGGVLPNAVKTIAGSAIARGSSDGVGASASFSNPQGIVAVGAALYIIDTGNNSIRRLDTLTNAVATFAVGFHSPHGITSDGTNLYVADTDDCTIRRCLFRPGCPLYSQARQVSPALSFLPMGLSTMQGTSM